MNKVILITGASSGFGRLTAEALAKAGHTVYASMRETTGRNAPEVAKVAAFSQAHGVDLRTIWLDVSLRTRSMPRSPRSSSTPGTSMCWSTMPAHGVRPDRGLHAGAARPAL